MHPVMAGQGPATWTGEGTPGDAERRWIEAVSGAAGGLGRAGEGRDRARRVGDRSASSELSGPRGEAFERPPRGVAGFALRSGWLREARRSLHDPGASGRGLAHGREAVGD